MPLNDDRFRIGRLPRVRLGRAEWLTRQAVRSLNADADDYQVILELVRIDLDAVGATIDRSLDANAADPLLRWSLLNVLGDVEDERTLDVLRKQALRRVPRPHRDQDGCEGPDDAEVVVVIRAVHGLGRLARKGSAGAIDALLEVVRRQERRSIRRPAIARLVEADPGLRDRILELVPEPDRDLVDVRVATSEDVVVPPPDEEPTEVEIRREPGRKLRLDRRGRAPLSTDTEVIR